MPSVANGAASQTALEKAHAARAAQRAQQVEVEGHLLDPAPYKRYLALKKLADAGKIADLKIKPSLTLYAYTTTGTRKAIGPKFHPLFSYTKDDLLIVEDVPASTYGAAKQNLRKHWEAQSGFHVIDVE